MASVVRGIDWTQHRDVIFYKHLRFNSSTRVQEEDAFKNLNSGEHFPGVGTSGNS